MSNKTHTNYSKMAKTNTDRSNDAMIGIDLASGNSESIAVESANNEVDESTIGTVVTNDPNTSADDSKDTTVEYSIVGIVSGCKRLNVRNKPTKNGDVICEVTEGTVLSIDENKSTEYWYYVTAGDVNGYCMKRYITFEQ